MRWRDRTHCLRGHPLEGPHVRHRSLKGRWKRRVCLICERMNRRACIVRRVRHNWTARTA